VPVGGAFTVGATGVAVGWQAAMNSSRHIPQIGILRLEIRDWRLVF
jgi:hypothetical protein